VYLASLNTADCASLGMKLASEWIQASNGICETSTFLAAKILMLLVGLENLQVCINSLLFECAPKAIINSLLQVLVLKIPHKIAKIA